jgi:hypothetical protein
LFNTEEKKEKIVIKKEKKGSGFCFIYGLFCPGGQLAVLDGLWLQVGVSVCP